jgi:hypothetical protein
MDGKAKALIVSTIVAILLAYGGIAYSILVLDLGVEWVIVFLCLIVISLCALKIFIVHDYSLQRREMATRNFFISEF